MGGRIPYDLTSPAVEVSDLLAGVPIHVCASVEFLEGEGFGPKAFSAVDHDDELRGAFDAFDGWLAIDVSVDLDGFWLRGLKFGDCQY